MDLDEDLLRDFLAQEVRERRILRLPEGRSAEHWRVAISQFPGPFGA
jgi:hypothetical protein